jgi:hypothetical protein
MWLSKLKKLGHHGCIKFLPASLGVMKNLLVAQYAEELSPLNRINEHRAINNLLSRTAV